MAAKSHQDTIGRFLRYQDRADFERWHAMALSSFVPIAEGYVLGIDCADRWLLKKWGTKLVLTDERVAAFRADPADPMKRTHWLEEIVELKYDTGLITGELRLIGADFYGVYTVPKHLGREFADAVEDAIAVDETEPGRGNGSAEPRGG